MRNASILRLFLAIFLSAFLTGCWLFGNDSKSGASGNQSARPDPFGTRIFTDTVGMLSFAVKDYWVEDPYVNLRSNGDTIRSSQGLRFWEMPDSMDMVFYQAVQPTATFKEFKQGLLSILNNPVDSSTGVVDSMVAFNVRSSFSVEGQTVHIRTLLLNRGIRYYHFSYYSRFQEEDYYGQMLESIERTL